MIFSPIIPQDLRTTASPTFANITALGLVQGGTFKDTSGTITGSGLFALTGTASGDNAIVMGSGVASGLNSIRIGVAGSATTGASVSIGNAANVTGIASTAIGAGANVSSVAAVQIGAGTNTTNASVQLRGNFLLTTTGLRIGSAVAPTVALDVTGAGLFSTTLGVTSLSTLTGGISIGAAGNIAKDTNDLTVTTAAQKTVVLSPAVYKDINIAGALLVANPTQVPGTDQFVDSTGTDTGIETFAFAEGEAVHGGFELQHDYKEGTDLVFHVHWQGIAAPTGTDNVQWELTYIVARGDTVLAAATTINTPDTVIDTQYECYRSDFAAITGTNFKIGDQFMFSLERVTATGDAYAGDALIFTAGIHYQVDTLGSRQIGTK